MHIVFKGITLFEKLKNFIILLLKKVKISPYKNRDSIYLDFFDSLAKKVICLFILLLLNCRAIWKCKGA
jgi:hypothetical protein